MDDDDENPFDRPASDEEMEPETDELQAEVFAEYVQRLDAERNQHTQEQEHEIVRLWEAKNILISKLVPETQPSSSSPDNDTVEEDNLSVSEVESRYDEDESSVCQQDEYPKLLPMVDRASSLKRSSKQSSTKSATPFIHRDRPIHANGHSQRGRGIPLQHPNSTYNNSYSMTNDDRSSGLGSLVPSPVQSPIMWRSERICGRGLCSSSIDYNRMDIEKPRRVKPRQRDDVHSDYSAFKTSEKSEEQGFFAAIRAKMEAAASSAASTDSRSTFDDQYINTPLLVNGAKTHFDFGEEFDYHQTHILPRLLQQEKEKRKQATTIDFSFKIGLDEPITDINQNETMTEEEPHLSIIVDNNDNGLKRVCAIFDQYQLVYDRQSILHDQWYYGLISYTFLLKQSVKMVNSSVMQLLQQQLKQCDTFWLSNGLKKRPIFNDSYFNIEDTPTLAAASQPPPDSNGQTVASASVDPAAIVPARVGKFVTLARCFFHVNCQMEWSSGALVAMNAYSSHEKLVKESSQKWCLFFCEDYIDFLYQTRDRSNPNYEYIKRIPANFVDKSVVVTTMKDGFVLYIQMKGNAMDITNFEPPWVARRRREQNQPVMGARQARQRQAPRTNPLPFCSTIRVYIKLATLKDHSQRKHLHRFKNETLDEYEYKMDIIAIDNIRRAFREFLAFFYRHRVQVCFAGAIAHQPPKTRAERIERPVFPTFIQNYCWQMLLSIGFRFQERVTQQVIDHLKCIEADNEFYQTAIYLWRRAKEYHFLNIYEEVAKFSDRLQDIGLQRRAAPTHVSSINHPPKNMAYIPSVTITPTTVCVKPFKLAKTNRVLREPKFGNIFNFCLVELKEETNDNLLASDFRCLRWKFDEYLEHGFKLTDDRIYKYLHHSQSQLKEKQYWFYWHDEKFKTNLSFTDAYKWMGDFEAERVVAKHSARIALCFTSSSQTIRVPTSMTKIIDDVERHGYIFTDGVGTFSTQLRDDVCAAMGIRRKFSVMQIRYGGCKGTISVNPELDYTETQLVLRKSMHKFNSTHEILELCKISAPRSLHLNRQAIVLLESRRITHSIFLLFQNEHLLWLVDSLLYLPSTFELLNERLPQRLFQLRDLILDAHFDLIHEPFFRQLITTVCQHEVKRIQDKTRIKISKNSGRNMFGIVDETGLLQYGQIFCQYTELNTERLNDGTMSMDGRFYNKSDKIRVVTGKIVVTKNPCHHPGDLRTFEAVDIPRLRHLVDCIVFPQQGKRPHPNEISGSDLDGDEYAVYWHPDLIPRTENFMPYDYDNQEKPKRLDRPVTRDDIRKVVLDISEQDALGRLSNLHLAYTDMHTVKHMDAVEIAEAISEEVDAGKTGKHPLTDQQIAELGRKLNYRRADFFNRPRQFDLYPSINAIGKLFRAIRRSEPGWLKINRCLHAKTTIGLIQSSHITAHVEIDPCLVHSLADLYLEEAELLFKLYRDQLIDIMYVYHFHSEVDLICKFDSQQQTMSRQFDIADSAQLELGHLIERVRVLFHECQLKNRHILKCLCEECDEHRMARASACYMVAYKQPFTKKILSFPWLFSSWLVKLRRANLIKQEQATKIALVPPSNFALVGQALLHSFLALVEGHSLRFVVDFPSHPSHHSCLLRLANDIKSTKYIYIRVSLLQWAMLEITTGWLARQNIFAWKRSSATAARPLIPERMWRHITTQFVFAKHQPMNCSALVLLQNSLLSKQQQQKAATDESNTSSLPTLPQFVSSVSLSSFPAVTDWWSDEQASDHYRLFIALTAQCSRTHPSSDTSERMDFAHLNEYLTLGLLAVAAENELGNVTWH